MNVERPSESCAALHEELLQQMYGDRDAMPAELQAHLAMCAPCRAALEAAQRMNAALRTALQPEPLSTQAVRTLRRQLAAEPARHWRARPHLPGLVGTAVAAGLVAALLLPWGWHRAAPRGPDEGTPGELVLSSQDAATILAAYTCVGWEGTTEAELRLLADQVSGVSRAVQGEEGTETYLPWDRKNDWDMPMEDGGALRAPEAAPRHRDMGVAERCLA